MKSEIEKAAEEYAPTPESWFADEMEHTALEVQDAFMAGAKKLLELAKEKRIMSISVGGAEFSPQQGLIHFSDLYELVEGEK